MCQPSHLSFSCKISVKMASLPPCAGAPGRWRGFCRRWHWHGFSRTPQGYRWHWGFLGRRRREDVANGDCHVPPSISLSLSRSLMAVLLLLLLYCAILWMEIRLCMKGEREGVNTRQWEREKEMEGAKKTETTWKRSIKNTLCYYCWADAMATVSLFVSSCLQR